MGVILTTYVRPWMILQVGWSKPLTILSDWTDDGSEILHQLIGSIKNYMGPNICSVSYDRAIRFSGFFGVRSVGPVGDFLDR